MFNKDAAELKKTVYAGTKVTIIKGPYGPFGEGFRTLKPGQKPIFFYHRQISSNQRSHMSKCALKIIAMIITIFSGTVGK